MSEAASNRDDPPGSPPGLALRRNAARGFGVGVAVAAAVFIAFAVLPGTSRPLGLYLGLAGVLAFSVGLLATIALVAWRVRRLTRTV